MMGKRSYGCNYFGVHTCDLQCGSCDEYKEKMAEDRTYCTYCFLDSFGVVEYFLITRVGLFYYVRQPYS